MGTVSRLRRIITIDENKIKGDKVALYLEGVNVIFEYRKCFDANTQEFDNAYGRFPVDEYRRGMEMLSQNGSCSVNGKDCSLELHLFGEQMEIEFEATLSGHSKISIYDRVKWKLDDIILK